MDGYSVQEAASVLGVAEGRVWELLARGVLLGTPEGDSMRVFFKAQPGPIASAGTHDEPPRTNGNGGSQASTGEASAFRELLTEFRNLTERYGQALLALGEARGEVAGLRSRVDQLEARIDLRLPPPVDAAPMAWDSLSVPASTPEPPRTMPRAAKPRPPARRKSRPAKARSPREAVAGFADALARAQDPNAADLGEARSEEERASEGSAEPTTAAAAAAPEAAIQDAWEATPEVATPEVAAPAVVSDALVADEAAAEELAEEASAPEVASDELVADEAATEELAEEASAPEPMVSSEVEPAEDLAVQEPRAEEPTAEVEPPTYSAVVVEPDWFADGDFAWLDAAERLEGSGLVSPVANTPDEAEPEPESAAGEPPPQQDLQPEPQAPEEPEEAVEPVRKPEPEEAVEPVREPEPEPRPEFEAAPEFESWQPPEPAAAELPASEVQTEPEVADRPEPPTMSTAVAVEEIEEEVMWLGREPEPDAVASNEPRLEHQSEADTWPVVDAAPVPEVVRPPLAMTEDELARLALDEGWDDAEVAAIRAMITPPPSSKVDLPGAAELHEAMAALEAVPVRANPSQDVARQWTKPVPDDNEPTRHDDWAFEAEPAPPPPAPTRPPTDVTSALRRTVADAGWLRRPGPAAAAYRRLRRLFPG